MTTVIKFIILSHFLEITNWTYITLVSKNLYNHQYFICNYKGPAEYTGKFNTCIMKIPVIFKTNVTCIRTIPVLQALSTGVLSLSLVLVLILWPSHIANFDTCPLFTSEMCSFTLTSMLLFVWAISHSHNLVCIWPQKFKLS